MDETKRKILSAGLQKMAFDIMNGDLDVDRFDINTHPQDVSKSMTAAENEESLRNFTVEIGIKYPKSFFEFVRDYGFSVK